ncbi:MAG TPA: CpaD family pilus assembly lipoprotein [Rhizomicrobium sp.]
MISLHERASAAGRKKAYALQALSIAAVLLAGSCAAPTNDGTVFADGLRNHPITVAPHYETVRVAFSDVSAGLSPEDESKLVNFVENYQSGGEGAISVSVPSGPSSSAALGYFGEHLAHLGVPRSRIMVGTHDAANGDTHIEIGYITYSAKTDPCGQWTQDAADTANNLPMPDFGCSVQHNIAAMVAEPRDLLTPRGMGAADATRRETVIGTYEKAQATASQKSADQSANLSGVGSGGQ